MTFTARGLYASSSKEPRGRRGRWWLVIGAIVGLAALGTGVLGGFTTLSVWAQDTHDLADAGRPLAAAAYALGTLAACLVAVALVDRLSTPAERVEFDHEEGDL